MWLPDVLVASMGSYSSFQDILVGRNSHIGVSRQWRDAAKFATISVDIEEIRRLLDKLYPLMHAHGEGITAVWAVKITAARFPMASHVTLGHTRLALARRFSRLTSLSALSGTMNHFTGLGITVVLEANPALHTITISITGSFVVKLNLKLLLIPPSHQNKRK